MAQTDDFFYLGKITKLHAYEGKLTVFFDTDEPGKYATLNAVFIKKNEGLIPYFFSELKLNNNKAIVRFRDVDTAEQAAELVGKELYLPLDQLPELTGNKFYYHEIVGFSVVDDVHGDLGKIRQVLEYPNQALLQLFYRNREVLIPCNDEIIRHVDRKTKTLTVHLPDGLLDIYIT